MGKERQEGRENRQREAGGWEKREMDDRSWVGKRGRQREGEVSYTVSPYMSPRFQRKKCNG